MVKIKIKFIQHKQNQGIRELEKNSVFKTQVMKIDRICRVKIGLTPFQSIKKQQHIVVSNNIEPQYVVCWNSASPVTPKDS